MIKDIRVDINLVKAELCKRDFFYFIQEFWSVIIPDDPVYNWHIEYLCKELQTMVERVANREEKLYDLIINIPPGTSKSTIATVMLPAWAWTIDPRIRSLSASYSASLSTDHAVKSRDIIKSDKYQLYFPELTIKKDQDNKTHYKNNFGGERYATSVTGTVTGFHAHLIIVDDPLNPKGASSEADRTTANNFMDVTLSTRKVNKSVTPTILVMQRLHQKDCTGNWIDKEGKNIKHICLPGELSNDVKPTELIERYDNGLLDNQRLTHSDLKGLKIDLGSYGYAGQIMQTPSPLGGGIWQKWIKPIDDKELDRLLPSITKMGSDWDLAYTNKETNSASAFVTAGVHENNMYIDALGFDWMEFPKLIAYMKARKSPHYIEAKASGKSAKQTLSNQGIPAIEVNVTGGDKEARANMVTPYAESGVVYCRRSILDKLYYDSKQGILVFPNGEGDDLQDALVQSISRLLGNPQVFFF
jgi:predicted phage terminase large subunit-like protein